MQYELECGHCGYQFVLDVVALPRAVKCAVCGGVLTLAVPVPVPPKPAPPKSATPVPHKPVPGPKPPTPARGDSVPEIRVRCLAPPWETVRFALGWARATTDLASILLVALTAITLVAGPRVQAAVWWATGGLPACVCTAFLLFVVVHAVCQWQCLEVPMAYGWKKVNASLALLPSAGIGVLGWCPGWAGVFFTLASTAALIGSLMFWLAFLTRLGQRLSDEDLADAARSFRVWLPFGLVLLATFLTTALVAAGAPSPPLVWFGQAAAGALATVLLRQYATLLRTAVEAIDRCAPAARD